MQTQRSDVVGDVVRVLARLLSAALVLATLVGICYLVILSPLLTYSFYAGGSRNWSLLGDIGQAYGPASALLSTVALVVVSASLVIERTKHRRAVRDAHRRRTRETVLLSMEEPAYIQCWGTRYAPGHIDERLFFFAGFVLLNWSFAWEDKLITESKLRELLRVYFDGEVPRMYWERNGDWHDPHRRWRRRERFEAIVSEEYLRALKRGPASRAYEPMGPTAAQPNAQWSPTTGKSNRPLLTPPTNDLQPSTGNVSSTSGASELRTPIT